MNRWHAFRQLILARLREFFREPHAIFWVYGFPLLLAIGLGLAFADSKPESPVVDVVATSESERIVQTLHDHGLTAAEHPCEVCKSRLRKSASALYLVPGLDGIQVIFDPTRADSVHA